MDRPSRVRFSSDGWRQSAPMDTPLIGLATSNGQREPDWRQP